jgi:hypothetical protein
MVGGEENGLEFGDRRKTPFPPRSAEREARSNGVVGEFSWN